MGTVGSNQRPLACEATAPQAYFEAICRVFIDGRRTPRADLLWWIAGVCRGCGPRERSVDQQQRGADGHVAAIEKRVRHEVSHSC